jgi:two-component system sensor histidine kinase AlgZ
VLPEAVRLIVLITPIAFISIAVLAACALWITRWPLSWVVALSLALVGVLTLAVAHFTPTLIASQALLVAWLGTLILWGILSLETRAKSPAFDIARLQALQARIRPHFLFNSLNAVASMVRSEPRKAETALMDLADLYRALMKDNRELTLLSEEVTLASQYLTLEKMRLAERLRIKWFTDNMPGDALVPPLVLQPLLENAVYHGIEPSPKGGDVVVNIFARREQLTIVVSNPYLGQHNQRRSRGNNMAVGNIRERLKLHFDVEGSLQQNIRGETYEVRVMMPYRKGAVTTRTRPA